KKRLISVLMHGPHVQHHISFRSDPEKEQKGRGPLSIDDLQWGRQPVESGLAAKPNANGNRSGWKFAFVTKRPTLNPPQGAFIGWRRVFAGQKRGVAVDILDARPRPVASEAYCRFECVCVGDDAVAVTEILVSSPDQT